MILPATQDAMARWMGYSDAAAMNDDHDPLHLSLCGWLGIRSHSLRQSRGEPHDPALAGMEEDAVLAVQRLIAHSGTGVPQ